MAAKPVRNLVLVLGDQLDPGSAAFDGFDRESDRVAMFEVREEATYIRQHKRRLVLFFAAMRHCRDALVSMGRDVDYVTLDDPANTGSFEGELQRCVGRTGAGRVIVLQPGDWRVREVLLRVTRALDRPLEIREDRSFYSTPQQFAEFAQGRRKLVMEMFYRGMRRRHDILMEGEAPRGGDWNYDVQNRRSFGRRGPPPVPEPVAFAPDETVRDVIVMVERLFGDHPGSTAGFDLPVTRAQARRALEDFVTHRLPLFGHYQDAIARGHAWLWHSRLSAALNLHLLDPRTAVEAAIEALDAGRAPLAAVEGFVRQILGWREYVRGIYWTHMPDYARLDALGADREVPRCMWDGRTEMACVRETVGRLQAVAYVHHIERLMVLGLWMMLCGARPYAVHQWHMAMYADAIDWVSLPNVLGMSQYGDGGIMGSKPYVASGNYIHRMSDHCRHCRFDPRLALGDEACPFTTLYWDF
ncbi:MAG: cryptochrome/photolyase family protein, partial [Geminicoccaceae bacterium]|nr:cryptochrome/photolyase family protein [Geminicoccaceae bacterium]